MDIGSSERRYAFSMWLRTGRLLTARTADGTELKFNPWHDPANGRFTFANGRSYQDGSWQGGGFPGRGGGSAGGGGATGSWEESPNKKGAAKPKPSDPESQAQAKPLPRHTAGPTKPPPLRREIRNGYEYLIDTRGRTRRVSGSLVLSDAQMRSRTAQAQAGGLDRRPSDDGGHYIAARLKGPTDAFNHFAQDSNFNRGGYRVLEDEWAREKRAGHSVVVKIAPAFGGASTRPSAINVWFTVDGVLKSKKFPNGRTEMSGGK